MSGRPRSDRGFLKQYWQVNRSRASKITAGALILVMGALFCFLNIFLGALVLFIGTVVISSAGPRMGSWMASSVPGHFNAFISHGIVLSAAVFALVVLAYNFI